MIRIRISSDSKPLDPEPSADPDDKTVEPSGGSANASDTNNVPLYTGILAASLMAAIALLLYRKKLSS